jgi:hypothetical protein
MNRKTVKRETIVTEQKSSYGQRASEMKMKMKWRKIKVAYKKREDS